MKTKINKLLYEYSKNSRITTKELGKRIGASQQSVSYLLKSLKKKKIIEFNVTIVDAVKLGYINVLVGFNFLNLESEIKKEVIEELKNIESITGIEEGKEGVDLLVEYSVPNLSAFNKAHTEIIHKFYEKIRTAFIFPLIVTHEYDKNYLTKKFSDTDSVLFGDRTLRELLKNELKVLEALVKNPEIKLIDLSDSIKLPIKSIINIKKALEKKYMIKGYTSIFNNSKIKINRQIIFLRFSHEGFKRIDEFHEFTKNNRNIIKFLKIIGEFQIAIYVESLKEIETLKEIRANFPIEDYLIIKSEKIHKKNYLPLDSVQ